MSAIAGVCIALIAALPISPHIAASTVPIDEAVTVSIDPTDASATLGESLELSVTVTNDGPLATPSLVVHIDITDPARSSSVDPEDWTSTLSKPAGVVRPGASVTVTWSIQPISGGTFTLYAVALAAGEPGIAVSDAVLVTVIDRRSLDPGGILPVAMIMPAIVGGLLVFRVRAARRPLRRAATAG